MSRSTLSRSNGGKSVQIGRDHGLGVREYACVCVVRDDHRKSLGGGILEEGLREEGFRMGCARWEGCNLIHVLVERVGCVDVGRAGFLAS